LEKKKLSNSDPNPKHKYRKVKDIKKEKLLPTSLFPKNPLEGISN